MTWRTGRAVPSLHNQTPQRFYFCEPPLQQGAPSTSKSLQHPIILLVSNSVKRDSSGCSKTPSSKASKKLTAHWTLLQAARMLFHKHKVSLHWRKRLDCTQPGHRCTVAWCAHLSTFHWSYHTWRPVSTSYHCCPRNLSTVMARSAAFPIPGSTTNTAPRLRSVGEVTS